MRTLSNYYKKGLIVYPRTESDYISDNNLFSYFPHPPLKIVNSYFEPLKQQKYEFDNSSMFLHFHNIRAVTPANYTRTKKKISGIIKEKDSREYIKIITNNYDTFLEEHNKLSRRYFLDNLLSHYKNEKQQKMIKLENYNNIDELYEEMQKDNKFYKNNEIEITNYLQ